MNFLITGGAGFIGSNLIRRLLKNNHDIACLDNLDDFYSKDFKWENIRTFLDYEGFHFTKGDVRDGQILDKIFGEHKIECVIHLAERPGIRPSLWFPELYFDVNARGTIVLLEAMKRNKVTNLVFASSSSVYGNSSNVPFTETDVVDMPLSPYAASKRSAELMCYNYHTLYGFNVFCLRLFMVYGPGQRPDTAIYKFTDAIMNDLPVSIYGDGSMKRDFTFIDDILDGIEGAVRALDGYEIINLGGNQVISILNLLKKIEIFTGKPASIVFQDDQKGDMQITYANTLKAQKMLGYSPKYSINEGLNEFILWYRQNRLNKQHIR